MLAEAAGGAVGSWQRYVYNKLSTLLTVPKSVLITCLGVPKTAIASLYLPESHTDLGWW